ADPDQAATSMASAAPPSPPAGRMGGMGGIEGPRRAEGFASPPGDLGLLAPSSQQKAGAPSPLPLKGKTDDIPAVPRGEVAIDPNGRFATTYRPGGGHLAAFESAVARGIVPAGERELVSDIGARYAPEIDAPKDRAMAMRVGLERAKLPPSGGPVHVRVALRSTAAHPSARPHLSVHLVLDVSGSMAGASITSAREAARELVEKLAPTDDFSMVTFSSSAKVEIHDGPVGSRLDTIKKTI